MRTRRVCVASPLAAIWASPPTRAWSSTVDYFNWSPLPPGPPPADEAAIVDVLKQKLGKAVESHLESEVPLGAFLSGGLDSSAVVSLMSRYAKGRVKTFAIGFGEPQYDESSAAREVAGILGTEHTELRVQPDVGCTVRAFGIIQSRLPDARLVIAGDGSQRRQLEELVQSLQLRGVEFTGKVDSTRMAALYSECDIYLNSPYIDNMPASILEAFACGLPVVSTNAGGIPYIVDDGVTGRLVPCRDHTAMAGAVLDLLADGASALRLADAARSQCERLYSWNGLQAQWERFYGELLRLQSPTR